MSRLPQHLAIIMDGNGRWATGRGHNRFFGHVRGAKAAKRIIEESTRLGIKNLTLFTFSTENWERPQEEVSFLMSLLARRLRRERSSLIKNNIRFRCIGELDRLPKSVLDEVQKTISETESCTGMNLVFALSYGGRQDLVEATKKVAAQVESGLLKPDQISEDLIKQNLATNFMPDPDLIIRTSGESRISNFFLWQAAYSEIYITPKMWPEFDETDLAQALATYARKERRFGKTSEQIKLVAPLAQEGV